MQIRARLKAATRSAHENLDELFSALDLTDPAGYRRFLSAHAMVLPACEATLAQSSADRLLPDWQARIRAPALAEDLTALGGSPVVVARPGVSLEPAAAFGMMYVLEGSRLGGAVLARRVQANPDQRCREAVRYLRHGNGLALWPTFITYLEDNDFGFERIESAVASALLTFGLFSEAARSVSARENDASSWHIKT